MGRNGETSDTCIGRKLTEMKGALLLDIVIRKSPSILKLFAGEDQTLLIGRDSMWTVKTLRAGDNRGNVPLLVLNLRFNIVNCIGRLHLKGDGLSCEGLYEDLHGCDGVSKV